MKLLAFTLCLALSACTHAQQKFYTGSTPAHAEIKNFLGIPLADSIDFIRWKFTPHSNTYELDCEYGIGKPNTNGFINRKTTSFTGTLSKQKNHYQLQHENKTLYILEINSNILHLLDQNKNLLTGNGGFSYALNSNAPTKSAQFNFKSQHAATNTPMAFQGRTPCDELIQKVKPESAASCLKIKWYIILYTNEKGQPTYFFRAAGGLKKENMIKGNWEIVQGKDGRIIYKLNPENKSATIHLVKADDNILFFTDAAGNLLSGNEDFSYTLNRTNYREPK